MPIFKWCSFSVALVLAGVLQTSPTVGQPGIMSGGHQVTATDGQGTSQQANQAAGAVLAVITQSRSTNTRGYTVTIHNDGSATAEIEGTTFEGRAEPPRSQQFPAGSIDTKTLRNLLTEIGDVSKIPSGGCVKSVSFGTRTEITYAGKTSGDLQCIRQEPSGGTQAQADEELGRFVRTTLGQLKIDVRRIQLVRPAPPSQPE
ncbi:MAG TPA: hypothetical protein VMT20_27180 [Terriglobia bacterium]|nr:hypothetical protein [Terriglobia bacterium]